MTDICQCFRSSGYTGTIKFFSSGFVVFNPSAYAIIQIEEGRDCLRFYLNPGNKGSWESIHSKIYVDKTNLIACTNRLIHTTAAAALCGQACAGGGT